MPPRIDAMITEVTYTFTKLAAATDLAEVGRLLPEVEACARELFAAKRNTVKHNPGTHVFEAGNIKFGLEMRR